MKIYKQKESHKKHILNPFSTNVSLLHPLKKSPVFYVSRRYRTGTLVENRLNCEYFPDQDYLSYVQFGSFSQIRQSIQEWTK